VQLGELRLRNRVVMAPMTRNRAEADGVPTALMAQYYSARSEAGLIVAEGAWPSPAGQAYCRQPGIATSAHASGWRAVTDAVHARGGLIVLQIMHAGRIGSHHIKGPGVPTVAPSALAARGEIFTDSAGMQPFDDPHALTVDEVRQVVGEYRQAAILAREAGFDGVELHGTSGYLPMQFLCTGTNQRDDVYGGSALHRSRFTLECLAAMAEAIGPGRVGLRVNPGNAYNDTSDVDPRDSHACLLRQAAGLGLAYVHVMRAPTPAIDAFALARECFGDRLIVNDGLTAAHAAQLVESGVAAATSFGRDFIGNPDLIRRVRDGLPLAGFDRKTLYTAGARGYTDYRCV
jgi:NADPH2 dehydrogenase/N-ethylmaleimide reductase